MSIKTVIVILFVAFIGVGFYFYSQKSIEGEWHAAFRIDPDLVNEGQVKLISLKFMPEKKVEYTLSVYQRTHYEQKSEWGSQTSSGETTNTQTFKGTYKLFFRDLKITFNQAPTSRTLVQPFMLIDARNEEDEKFIKVRSKAYVSHGRLNINTKKLKRAIEFTHDPEGFLNQLYYAPEKVDHDAFVDRPQKDMQWTRVTTTDKPDKNDPRQTNSFLQDIYPDDPPKAAVSSDSNERGEFKRPMDILGNPYENKGREYERNNAQQAPSPYQPYTGETPDDANQGEIDDMLFAMAQAAEDYARDNQGMYPPAQTALSSYIESDQLVCQNTISGYKIECLWSDEEYLVYAKNSAGTLLSAYTTGKTSIDTDFDLFSAIHNIAKTESGYKVLHEQIKSKQKHNYVVVSWLRSLATAAEVYATSNAGEYPYSIDDLLDASPPYINTNVCDLEVEGYTFSCEWMGDGYEFIAENFQTGDRIRMSTGGVME